MSFTRHLCGAVALLGGAAALLGTAFSGVHPEGPPPGHTGGFGEPTCHACHFDAPPDPEEGDLTIRPLGPAGSAAPADLCVLEVRLRSPDIRSAGFQLSARHAAGQEEGGQAGELVTLDERVQVVTDPGTGTQYAGQTAIGSEVESGGGADGADEGGADEDGPDGAEPAGAEPAAASLAEVAWRVGWRPPAGALGACAEATGASAAKAAGGRNEGSTARAEAPGPASGPAVLLHAAANAGNDDASPFGDRVYTAELAWPPEGTGTEGAARAPDRGR